MIFRSCVIFIVLIYPTISFGSFTLVATHPEAQARYASGTAGRHLKVLREYNNRIYLGYGQDDQGTIPGSCTPYYTNPNDGRQFCDLVVRYYDTTTDTLSAVQDTLRSQEIDTIEVMGGNVYLLAEDRDGSEHYVKCSTSSCFTDNFGTSTTPAHVYSATSVGNTMYMAGSGEDGSAALWQSTDDGNTWSDFYKLYPAVGLPDYPDCCSRFYHVGGPYEGDIYVHQTTFATGSSPNSDKYDGTSWQPSLKLSPFTIRMREFAGSLIYKTGSLKKYTTGNPFGETAFPSTVSDFTISNGWLYVLLSQSANSEVYRTKNLTSWFHVDTAPSNALTLEVSNGAVYVGTRNSELYKSDKNLDDPNGTLVPIFYLLLLDEE